MTDEELKRQALLIAAQLPTELDRAMCILSYTREVILALEHIGESKPTKTRGELRLLPGSSDRGEGEARLDRRDKSSRG
jgi:hypothetical protein